MAVRTRPATATNADPIASATRVVDAIRMTVALIDALGEPTPAEVFRLWWVAFVPNALRPDSVTPKPVQANHRRCPHALSEAIAR